MSRQLEVLHQLIRKLEILEFGNFALAAGRQTDYYFDGRRLSLNPEGSQLLGAALLPSLRAAGAEAIGGPATGTLTLVTALTLASLQEPGPPLPGFYTRQQPKGYGGNRLLEGCPLHGQPVAIVDDVCSTGDSLFQTIDAAQAAGCPIVKVLTIVDRREGGGDRLRRSGCNYETLFILTHNGEIRPADNQKQL